MDEVAAILEIIASISSTLALDEILAEVAEKTAQIMAADGCAISLWDPDKDEIVVMADYIVPAARIENDIEDIGQAYALADFPATAQVLRQQIPLVTYANDPTGDPVEESLLRLFQWAGVLMLPMIYKGRTIGLMEIYTDDRERYQFDDKRIKVCQALANQAAVAIENARLFSELETQQQALSQLSLRLINAQEEERRRISRELHDELGQVLTALKLNVQIVGQELPDERSSRLHHSLEEAIRLAAQMQETVRALSLRLHSPMLDDLGLIPTLRWELDHYARRTGQMVQFEADLPDLSIPPDLKITIYRVVIEALTNVARHAQAQHLQVYLRLEQQQLLLGIEDDGQGFAVEEWFRSPTGWRSLGLLSMQERVHLLAGRFQIISKPGSGTKILAQFPLSDKQLSSK